MTNLLLGLIYLAFISLGLPDALLGAAWLALGGLRWWAWGVRPSTPASSMPRRRTSARPAPRR